MMSGLDRGRDRLIGLACASGAVGLGLVYLAAAGAPTRMIGMNIAAWLVGLAAYVTVAVPRWQVEKLRPLMLPELALLLLATALAATPVEGATRWVSFGPLTLQVSLLVLPAMLVLFARGPSGTGAAALAVASLALAFQPDRAMAGALAAGLAALAWFRPERLTLAALAAALAGFAVTSARPDDLPAVPFVDGIFYSSFDVHPLAGAAVLLGAALLIVPALIGTNARAASLTFAALWLAILIAAALGNYPTPLVGYGGSAIVGYLLSLAVLISAPAAQVVAANTKVEADDGDGQSLSARLV